MAEKKEKVNFSIKGMTVSNVRRLADNVIAFSLLGNGLGLYNMRVVNTEKHGEFVATPQQKGSDGNYYSLYAVYLDEADEAKIIKKVKSMLPDDKPEAGDEF